MNNTNLVQDQQSNLTADEWTVYECLTKKSGTSMQDYFKNVHEKITQNIREKYVLAA